MDDLVLKWLHILSSAVLFGTGIGSAFSLLVATLGRDSRTVAAIGVYGSWPTGSSPRRRPSCNR